MKRLFSLVVLLLSLPAIANEVSYTNFVRPGPIEIHVIRFPRKNPALEIHSVHSGSKAIGRSAVSQQLNVFGGGERVAAINGDFFQLEGPFAGDPRGLQIVEGALISAPAGTCSFWVDADGSPHLGITRSGLRIIWPNGSSAALGLNQKCDADAITLYTPDVDAARLGTVGREFVLVPGGETSMIFSAGQEYSLKIVETKPTSGAFLLVFGESAATRMPKIREGAVVRISTATVPNLRGVMNAVSGGPILIRAGKQQRFEKAESNAFKDRFKVEKHPRTALGWSAQEYFWVEVDGRRKESIGMTLNELGSLMAELGCVEAMNLDGGGSSTVWFEGKVRNRPSDGAERPVANSLVLVRKSN
jgi:hypothetical protein